MSQGTASVVINCPPDDVWAAIADVTRIGDWSPECVAGRWIGGATAAVVGARFEGDNVVMVAGRTVKTWTTTSAISTCEPGRSFEFVAENHTTWRYDPQPEGDNTRGDRIVQLRTEGLAGLPRSMTKGMHRTLLTMEAMLEAT